MNTQNGAQVPTVSACLDLVLSRLDKVKSAGPSKWKACCPAHNDKEPSLSIREAADGKVLLHCWAGCESRDITAAIGLELRDLFPRDHRPLRGPSKAAQQFEATIISIALSMQAQGCRLTAEEQARFEVAKQRLGVAV